MQDHLNEVGAGVLGQVQAQIAEPVLVGPGRRVEADQLGREGRRALGGAGNGGEGAQGEGTGGDSGSGGAGAAGENGVRGSSMDRRA